MHYVITGSLGHTGKPITEGLLKAGHTVTVITSKAENADAIDALGAKPAVGDVADADFLRNAFAGADAVYDRSVNQTGLIHIHRASATFTP